MIHMSDVMTFIIIDLYSFFKVGHVKKKEWRNNFKFPHILP